MCITVTINIYAVLSTKQSSLIIISLSFVTGSYFKVYEALAICNDVFPAFKCKLYVLNVHLKTYLKSSIFYLISLRH